MQGIAGYLSQGVRELKASVKLAMIFFPNHHLNQHYNPLTAEFLTVIFCYENRLDT